MYNRRIAWETSNLDQKLRQKMRFMILGAVGGSKVTFNPFGTEILVPAYTATAWNSNNCCTCHRASYMDSQGACMFGPIIINFVAKKIECSYPKCSRSINFNFS